MLSFCRIGRSTHDDEEGRDSNPEPEVGRQSQEEEDQRLLQTLRPEVRVLHGRNGRRRWLPLQPDDAVLRGADGSPVHVLGHGVDGIHGIDGSADRSQFRIRSHRTGLVWLAAVVRRRVAASPVVGVGVRRRSGPRFRFRKFRTPV